MCLLRDTDPDSAAATGIQLGPPDLDELDFEEVKREINDAMVRDGVLSIKDLSRQPNAVTKAVRDSMVHRVVALLKAQEVRT